jgi:Protein of unknown function (DUF2934)
MNPNSPSHESVTQRAQQIWRDRGCPSGQDTQIWLEAERQLAMTASADNAPSRPEGRGNGNSQSSLGTNDPKVAPPTHERPADAAAPHPTPAEASALSAQQKKSARAPKQPAKVAPKAKPPESGKPIWDKPHSS